MKRLCAALAIGVTSLAAHPLAAQRLRGQVVLPDSTTPASGAIVVATGDNGALVKRALVNERGAFDLPLPHAGKFDVRVLRVGFRPTEVASPDVAADETRTLRIVVGSERIALARVTVRG